MNILITGFEPFDSHINASEVLVHALADSLDIAPNTTIEYAILPCNSLALSDAITALFDKTKPDLCLMLGQATGRNKITLERVALNIKDFSLADNNGYQATGEPIINEGPAAYWATLCNMQESIASMNTAGIPATISNHAGTYLCNQALYQALHLCQQTKRATQCGFMHIPLLPEQLINQHANSPFMPLEMSKQAIKVLLDTYVRTTV